MKIVPGGNSRPAPPGGRVSKRLMQLRLARQAAIERELARYILMDCGHGTTLETQQLWGWCRPKGRAMCEICGDWQPITKPPAPPLIEEDPLF